MYQQSRSREISASDRTHILDSYIKGGLGSGDSRYAMSKEEHPMGGRAKIEVKKSTDGYHVICIREGEHIFSRPNDGSPLIRHTEEIRLDQAGNYTEAKGTKENVSRSGKEIISTSDTGFNFSQADDLLTFMARIPDFDF